MIDNDRLSHSLAVSRKMVENGENSATYKNVETLISNLRSENQ